MKVLILVSCTLAIASAGYAPLIHHVPLDTPEVQAAKASHFAAHLHARAGHHGLITPLSLGHLYRVPAITHNGLPLDTPEVAAAKLQHHLDYAVAAQRNGVHVSIPTPLLSAHPIDTPEVQLAKAAHFAAHAEATARNAHGPVHYRKRRGIYSYGQHVQLIDHNGVPLDTPEVQAAKAEHFAAHIEAASRSGHVAVPLVHSGPYAHHVPLISHEGVPLDTPEVQAAKAHHFAAHAEAASRTGHYSPLLHGAAHVPAVIGYNGAPVETPEVQHAKAAHFAAHAAARGHHY